MTISGRTLLGAVFLLMNGFLNPVFAETSLSSTTVRIGEPLEIRIEVRGGGQAEIIRQSFVQDGVRADYSGVESSTTMINGSVTHKKVLKYIIIPSKAGKFKTPEILYQAGSKTESSGRLDFTVENERYRRKSVSPFDNFFQYNGGSVAEEDVKVRFYTDKKEAYVGESITGYFVLLYRTDFIPGWGLTGTAAFPWFMNEPLKGVSIKLPASLSFEGKEYRAVMHKDDLNQDEGIYALTPMKAGRFTLGETGFEISAGPFSGAFGIQSIPAEVLIRKLPDPAPAGFEGEVGDYDITAEFSEHGTAGEGMPLKIIIEGDGGGSLFKDPAGGLCLDLPCKTVLTGKNVNKRYGKLKSGQYGILSKTEFSCSIIPEKEGILQLHDLDLVFFNPAAGKYITRKIKFKPFSVGPKKAEAAAEHTETGSAIPFWLVRFLKRSGIVIAVAIFLFLLYTKVPRVRSGLVHIYSLVAGRFSSPAVEDLSGLDKITGAKKGLLLKNYLKDKGVSETDIKELLAAKNSYGNRPFSEVVHLMTAEEQRRLAIIQKRITEVLT